MNRRWDSLTLPPSGDTVSCGPMLGDATVLFDYPTYNPALKMDPRYRWVYGVAVDHAQSRCGCAAPTPNPGLPSGVAVSFMAYPLGFQCPVSCMYGLCKHVLCFRVDKKNCDLPSCFQLSVRFYSLPVRSKAIEAVRPRFFRTF